MRNYRKLQLKHDLLKQVNEQEKIKLKKKKRKDWVTAGIIATVIWMIN